MGITSSIDNLYRMGERRLAKKGAKELLLNAHGSSPMKWIDNAGHGPARALPGPARYPLPPRPPRAGGMRPPGPKTPRAPKAPAMAIPASHPMYKEHVRTGFDKYAHNASQWAKGHKKMIVGAGGLALAGTAFSNNTGVGSSKGTPNQARGMYGF